MSDRERNGINVIFSLVNGVVWLIVALMLGASLGAACLVGVATALVCWFLLRVFQVMDDAAR